MVSPSSVPPDLGVSRVCGQFFPTIAELALQFPPTGVKSLGIQRRTKGPRELTAICALAENNCGDRSLSSRNAEGLPMKKAVSMLALFCLIALPLIGQTAQKIASINKKVVGKWVSANGKSYIEFRPDGSCTDGSLWADGKWHIQPKHARCMAGKETIFRAATVP